MAKHPVEIMNGQKHPVTSEDAKLINGAVNYQQPGTMITIELAETGKRHVKVYDRRGYKPQRKRLGG